ncbi:hypothetical protein RTBOTA2_006038, partial [Rhodotorula toruloides]
ASPGGARPASWPDPASSERCGRRQEAAKKGCSLSRHSLVLCGAVEGLHLAVYVLSYAWPLGSSPRGVHPDLRFSSELQS